MKKRLSIIFLFVTITSFSQKNSLHYKSNLNFGAGIELTTFLNLKQDNNKIIITSPKNADYRIFGRTKGFIARILGKSPKKGILMTINCNVKNDSIVGNMKIPMFGKLKFKGTFNNTILNGKMFKNDTLVIGTIKGKVSDQKSIDYKYLYPKIIEVTKKNIFSKKELQTKNWKKNIPKIKKLLDNVQDDIELYIGFNMLGSKFSFSHYGVFIQKEKDLENQTRTNKEDDEINEVLQTSVFYKEIDKHTAYLQIKNFSTSQKELSIILPKIVEKNYSNLIIDLRNNGGGGLEASFEFAKYIINEKIVVGYFVTNKLNYTGFQKELFEKLPIVKMQSTQEFVSNLKEEKGAKLIFKKKNNTIFSNNLYILTNEKTASTCEPIVYLLKKTHKATIIGENTMGAMLSASMIEIDGKYKLYLPIADFYTYDGVRIEGVGVAPDIETKSEKALDKTLEIINNLK